MLPAAIDDHRRNPAIDIAEPAADQREALLARILGRRREVDLAVEPGLDRMTVGRDYVDRMAGLQCSDMRPDDAVERIASMRLPAACIRI
ncbi:MAG: hypothetical protein AB7O95_04185 [Geminicoccaceae bacterium]